MSNYLTRGAIVAALALGAINAGALAALNVELFARGDQNCIRANAPDPVGTLSPGEVGGDQCPND